MDANVSVAGAGGYDGAHASSVPFIPRTYVGVSYADAISCGKFYVEVGCAERGP